MNWSHFDFHTLIWTDEDHSSSSSSDNEFQSGTKSRERQSFWVYTRSRNISHLFSSTCRCLLYKRYICIHPTFGRMCCTVVHSQGPYLNSLVNRHRSSMLPKCTTAQIVMRRCHLSAFSSASSIYTNTRARLEAVVDVYRMTCCERCRLRLGGCWRHFPPSGRDMEILADEYRTTG